LFNIEITGAYDPDLNKLAQFKKIHSIKRSYQSSNDLINDNEINTIYICSPTAFHKADVLKAVDAHKNVFCEKPLATNLADVKEMCTRAKTEDVVSQVGFVIRYMPIFNYIRDELIKSSELGKMMTIMFRDDQKFPINGKYMSDWRAKKEISGGGTLIEHSIHDIDAIMAIAGKFKKIYCTTKFFSKYNVEDLAILNFELENKVSGTLTSCWHTIERDERYIEIFFEKGWLNIQVNPMMVVNLQIGKKRAKKLDISELHQTACSKQNYDPNYLLFPYYYEDLEFIRAINDNLTVKTGFEEALEVHKVIDAAYKSAETQQPISL